MPEMVFDTCVLSNFSLSHSFKILQSCYSHHAYVTSFVVAENLKGIQRGYKELDVVKKALTEGWLMETSLKGEKEKALFETLSVSLGLGESSSIAVAKVRGFTFASDDRVARREASLLHIPLTGTVGILCKAVQIEVVTLQKGDIILGRMKEKGFYTSVKSLKELLG